MMMTLSSDQVRAARALLHIEQSDLAQTAAVSVVTIRRLEADDTYARVSAATLAGVRLALERAGAEFIPGGVRRRLQPDTAALFGDLQAITLQSAKQLAGEAELTEADLYDEDGLPA